MSLSSLPNWIPPQLSKLVDKAPSGDKWIHEIKLDGFRMGGAH
jgi:bifunctional non-homologous end joining protein LigD